MSDDRSKEPRELATMDLTEFIETASRQTWPASTERLEGPTSFRLALGEEPIQLGPVEFRILLFLASRPYHPFTRRSIAEAVATAAEPVTEDTVDAHIGALRDQLGVFYDYVQTVPYVGYRFKA